MEGGTKRQKLINWKEVNDALAWKLILMYVDDSDLCEIRQVSKKFEKLTRKAWYHTQWFSVRFDMLKDPDFIRIRSCIINVYIHDEGRFILKFLKEYQNIKSLKFGYYFNQSISGILPDSLISLTFGTWFEQPISGNLPKSLQSLTFGRDFNRSILGGLPESLVSLEFGYDFNQPISGRLPKSLRSLTLSTNYPQHLRHNLPAFTKFI